MFRSKVLRRLPPLHSLRAFEAAARHLSVKKAAAELAVTPTAVSHHIRVLEDALGVKLFERHVRHIELTPYGRDLYPALREGFDKFADAISRLKAGKLRTVVTLSATVAFTARWLVPRVPAFHRDHPGMDLRLHASDEPVDLRSGIADAAIRYGRGEYEGYTAETLFKDAYAPVCSPRLRLRGVALLSLALVSDELARGALVQPFGPTLQMEGYRYDLVYLPAQKDSAAIAALREWIRRELPES